MIGTRKALSLRMPTAGITFQVMRDGTPVVDETLRMPLVSALPRIEELLKPWNHIANERFTGMTRRNIMDYNHEVLREAVLNAVCHRDYSILAPVAIQLDETGLTVSSPGGFMRGVDVDNLLTVSPSPRNQALADVLKRCGYVERTGRGVDRIYAVLLPLAVRSLIIRNRPVSVWCCSFGPLTPMPSLWTCWMKRNVDVERNLTMKMCSSWLPCIGTQGRMLTQYAV